MCDNARSDPASDTVQGVRVDDLLDGPQRSLPADGIEQQTRRLLAVCASHGVEAVVGAAVTSRELLLSLADACHQAGLTEAAQYLCYLDQPYD